MKLGIIILYWKNKSLSLKLLNQLFEWKLRDTVLVLVQNETEQDNFPETTNPNLIKICSSENTGFGGGMNLGFEELNKHSVDYTLLLNADIEIDKAVVLQLTEYLIEQPNTFAVGPKIVETFNGETKHYIGGRNIAQFVNTRIEANATHQLNESFSVDYVIGAVILLNHHHLQKTGFFDEDFFFSGEVAELCYRANQKGYTCATLANNIAYHYLEEATLRDSLYKYYNFRNRFLFMSKHLSQKKYLRKWYWIICKDLIYNLISFNLKGTKTALIIIHDVFFKIKGNQHHKFIKNKK